MVLSTEHIKQMVAEYFKNKPVKKVWLFGSYARGEADESSDVDVVVDIDKDAKVGLDYFGWHIDLSEKINRKVDVISSNGINHRIRPYIEKDMTLIYER